MRVLTKVSKKSQLELIQQLFPFHIGLNEHLNIISIGRAISKIIGFESQFQNLNTLFEICRPNIAHLYYEDLVNHVDTIFILSFRKEGINFKGQFVSLDEEGLVFICSLMIRDRSLLSNYDLKLNDFNSFDSLPDFLFAVEAQQASIKETMEISKKLKKQKEKLLERNEEIKQYAYIVSHDLQTPLRNIISFLQLLERSSEKKLSSNEKEYLDFSVQAAKRLHTLTQDLLRFTNVQWKELHFKPVDLNVLLMHIKNDFKISIDESNAIIEISNLPTILADSTLIQQLFQNLISNAIKYKSEKRPHIFIKVVDEKENWIFSVKDNGIGMESKYLENIFRVFKRLHTNEKFQGNGIGLSICKKIVNLHGGNIWVESVVGEGSTFFFSIKK